MAEREVVEYVANSAWQVPLLALGAWALVKIVRPGVLVEHWVWLAALALAVGLPMRGIERDRPMRPEPMAEVVSVEVERAEIALMDERAAHAAQDRPQDAPQASQRRWWDGVRKRGLVLGVAATRWVVGLYAAAILFGAMRLLSAWLAARRLVRQARELDVSQAIQEALARCRDRIGVELPRLRESNAIAGPVVVGAASPVLLLPAGFWEHTDDEVRAALLHELAHVRRRDYLVNVICQMAALPVVWHPAAWSIQRRIRMTREMVCDAIAAEEMQSGAGYARCLVALARQMLARRMRSEGARTQALGLFEKGTMEERVMRLTETDRAAKMSGQAKALRAFAGAAAMLSVMLAAATFHVRPTFAAASAAAAGSGAAAQSGTSTSAPAPAPAAVAGPGSAAGTGATAEPGSAAGPGVAFQATVSGVKVAPSIEPVQQEKAAGVSSPPNAEDDWPTAVAGKGGYVHRWIGADGKKYVTANHDPNEPTAEERLRIERNLQDSQKELDEMKLNGADLEGLQKDLASTDTKAQVDEAKRLANDPKLKQQVKELQKQAAELQKNAQLDLLKSPEWQKQMADMQKSMSDAAWQKQMAELEKNAELKVLNSPEWKKQMAEIQKSMADMSEEMQLKMATSSLAGAQVQDAMAQAQKELASGEMKAKLDAAQKTLDEVRKQMEELQKK